MHTTYLAVCAVRGVLMACSIVPGLPLCVPGLTKPLTGRPAWDMGLEEKSKLFKIFKKLLRVSQEPAKIDDQFFFSTYQSEIIQRTVWNRWLYDKPKHSHSIVYGELVSYHSAPCIVTVTPLHNCHIGQWAEESGQSREVAIMQGR